MEKIISPKKIKNNPKKITGYWFLTEQDAAGEDLRLSRTNRKSLK
jgi:hypothetical protein